jgi:pre-mRNA-processing factor SLU7
MYKIYFLKGNHSSVWGSFWNEGKWGFKCCYSFVKVSYCTGATGRENFESTLSTKSESAFKKIDHDPNCSNSENDTDKPERKKHKKKKKKKDKKKHEDTEDFETQVAKAMEKQRKEEAELERTNERKRAYNSLSGGHDKTLTEAVSPKL